MESFCFNMNMNQNMYIILIPPVYRQSSDFNAGRKSISMLLLPWKMLNNLSYKKGEMSNDVASYKTELEHDLKC